MNVTVSVELLVMSIVSKGLLQGAHILPSVGKLFGNNACDNVS